MDDLQGGRADFLRSRLHWLLPAICAWIFYVSLSHEALRRILALDTVETYAFAVFNQLLYNFSHYGHFFQSIHRGYDNSWMWSGHKAAVLPLVGYLYGLKPSPFTLAQIQIGAVALGAFPAYGFGRHCLGGLAGGVAGLVLYFAYPPLYFIALNDYQDVIISIPFLMMALYQSRRGSMLGFLLTGLLACLTREELALIMTLVGFGVPGDWRRRLRFGMAGVAVGLSYLLILYLLFHGQMRFEAPAQTQIRELLSQFPPHFPTLEYDKAEAARFYLGLLSPVQWLAIGSPITLIPGAGAFIMHAMVNPGNGVDRAWNAHAHIHHLAVLLPLIVAASLETLGWMLRLFSTRGRIYSWITQLLLALLLVSAVLAAGPPLRDELQLRLELSTAARPWPIHPVWKLLKRVPSDAVIATDKVASLAVSVRSVSYTYDESLEEKIQGSKPLDSVDYLLANRRDTAWIERAESRPGASVVAEEGDYILIKLK